MKLNQKKIVFAVLMGAVFSLSLATSAKAQSAATQAWGGDEANDKWKDGEVGYTMGCSLAGSLGIPVCGELPSGRQFNTPNSADDNDALDADSSEDEATPEVDQTDGANALNEILQEQQELQQQIQSNSTMMYNTQRYVAPMTRTYVPRQVPRISVCTQYCNK